MNATSIFLGLLIELFTILLLLLDAETETAASRVSITKDVPILWIDYISTESPLLGMRRSQFPEAVGP